MDFRAHFPFFEQHPDWTYLDSAATTLKPQVLLEASAEFYRSAGSVHRSQYDLPQSQAYERARALVAERFHVAPHCVIWTSGTTHALNLVAHGLALQLAEGDEILISVAEHHANYLPWQQLALRSGAKLVVLPLDENLQLSEAILREALSARTKIVALNLVSNVSGVRQPVEQLIPLIRRQCDAKIVLDLAQAVLHESLDCQTLDADYYAFSAHKMYGPTGTGALIGKEAALRELTPLFFGGKMLKSLENNHLVLAELPYCLEAGTPNIAGIIGFGAVLEWLNCRDFPMLNRRLFQLGETLYHRLNQIEPLQILGSNPQRTTLSFKLNGQHHADINAILTEQKIAIRVGEHCAKPYLNYLNESGTLRASLAHYNNGQDIERLAQGIELALAILD